MRYWNNWVKQGVRQAMKIGKKSPFMPYMSGKLKSSIYQSSISSSNKNPASAIVFDASIAPYIPFLEYGTGPHDIPNSFGYGERFGIGGRFSGKFHPGSKKHVGFISHDFFELTHEIIHLRCMEIGRVISDD